MLYNLLYPLADTFGPFNLFRYLTFRSIGAFLTALVLSFIVGGTLTGWRSFSDSIYYAQRFTSGGAVAPGWPAPGIKFCNSPQERDNLRLTSDGQGGALFSWYDYRAPQGGSDIYAARVLSGGMLAPGWTSNGQLVSDPSQGNESMSDIAPDGSGGAYVAWEWGTSFGRPSRLTHRLADGSLAPGWPAFGYRVAETTAQYEPHLASDGAGGVIVAWDERGGPDRRGIIAKRYNLDGPVAARLSLVAQEETAERVILTWFGTGAEC